MMPECEKQPRDLVGNEKFQDHVKKLREFLQGLQKKAKRRIDALRTERDSLKAENKKLKAECLVARERLGPGGYEILSEVTKLRACLKRHGKFLQKKAKRSSYEWSVADQFQAEDAYNEGQIQCAEEALAEDDALDTRYENHNPS